MLLLAAAAASPALAAPEEGREEVAISFEKGIDPINSFVAVKDDLLYLEDREGRWYRVRFDRRCPGLKKAKLLAFELRQTLSLDRTKVILMGDERCEIRSLTYGEPPRRARKKASKH